MIVKEAPKKGIKSKEFNLSGPLHSHIFEYGFDFVEIFVSKVKKILPIVKTISEVIYKIKNVAVAFKLF